MTDKAYAVPLHELLASVPRDTRLVIDDSDGKGTRFIPIGRMCHQAAAELRRLHEENAELVEACQLVIRAYNKLQPASSNQGKEPLEIFAIRAALAKAQGEEQ